MLSLKWAPLLLLSCISLTRAAAPCYSTNSSFACDQPPSTLTTTFNSSATSAFLAKGSTAVGFMRLTYPYSPTTFEPITGLNMTTMSASFYPRVDELSALYINSSWPTITNLSNAGIVAKISFDLLWNGTLFSTSAKLLFQSAAVSQNAAAALAYVRNRTAVVTLSGGSISKIDWEPTSCTTSSCSCVESICGETCSFNNINTCNIQIYLGWAGTDVDGNVLTSASRSVWKFMNAF
ncbi:hypothetical protein SeLEV6574_g05621 [Synchytrium endobioticum]|nr:hypothetical protein SeLEV6574_g05621 [Synchytrium endobioticum]